MLQSEYRLVCIQKENVAAEIKDEKMETEELKQEDETEEMNETESTEQEEKPAEEAPAEPDFDIKKHYSDISALDKAK